MVGQTVFVDEVGGQGAAGVEGQGLEALQGRVCICGWLWASAGA